MFYVDVAKVDLDIVMLHMFYTHVKNILSRCCIFNERFEYSMQHETDVAADFFPHHQRMVNNFFSIFLMMQIVIFYITDVFFCVAAIII